MRRDQSQRTKAYRACRRWVRRVLLPRLADNMIDFLVGRHDVLMAEAALGRGDGVLVSQFGNGPIELSVVKRSEIYKDCWLDVDMGSPDGDCTVRWRQHADGSFTVLEEIHSQPPPAGAAPASG